MSRPLLSIFPERRPVTDWAPPDAYGPAANPAAHEDEIERQVEKLVNELVPDNPDNDQDAG